MTRTGVLLALAIGLSGCAGSTSAAPGLPPRPDVEETGPVSVGGRGDAVRHQPPATARYAISRLDSVLLEFPGGTQVQVADWTPYLTVTTAAAGEGYRLTAVLDSLVFREGQMPPDSIAGAEGTRWTGTLTPNGEVTALTSDKVTVLGQQIGGMLRQLFPVLPAGGARAGAEWSDTTELTVPVNAVETRQIVRTRYRALQRRNGGEEALPIEAEGELEQQGSGTQFGQQVQLDASGTRHTTYLMSGAGFLLEATGRDSTAMVFTVPEIGQSIHATQRGTFSVARLPSGG